MWSVPGASLCPMMWARSFGIPYLSHSALVSAAEARYIVSVNQDGSSMYPSCSMPSADALACFAWYAVSLSRTVWVICPSEERTT